MGKKRFDFFADTGGTFTDCIAEDESGRIFRKKVLSSGAVRGTIKSRIAPARFRIEESWDVSADIFKGYHFRLLKGRGEPVKVSGYDPSGKILSLEEDIAESRIESNAGFELFSGEEAPVLGARLISGTGLDEELPVKTVKLGSTKGTNALLEKKGSSVLFVVTAGFEDILRIRYQQRPDIFARNVILPDPLYSHVIGVDERTESSGNIMKEPDMDRLRQDLDKINTGGRIGSVAIALMNSCKNPRNERAVRDFFAESGFKYISVSSELSGLIKFVPRSETTVVNAYLDEIIDTYISGMMKAFRDAVFFVMNSAGGLARASGFKPKESLLSGPAGGVVGAVSAGLEAGFDQLITFDMGGTSTDVSRYSGHYDYRFEHEVGDARIVSPALAIETVAAGGGSICYFDGFKLCVGPESAGAFPGPACYGAGGPLTITDVNLLSGRMDPRRFGIPVFPEEAERKLGELISEIESGIGEKRDRDSILSGFLNIANEIMAGAIKKVSVLKGYDPSEHSMVAFGGAGGMHACPIADQLNIQTVLLPEDSGLLSAYGISRAPVERIAERQLLQSLKHTAEDLNGAFDGLEEAAAGLLTADGIDPEDISVRSRLAYLRIMGQDSAIEVEYNGTDDLTENFNRKYFQIYGYNNDRDDLEVESIRVIASSGNGCQPAKAVRVRKHRPVPQGKGAGILPGKFPDIPVYLRTDLKPGALISGYALILDDFSTWVVEEGWELELTSKGTAVMKKCGSVRTAEPAGRAYDEIELELFTNRFMSIAENMGSMLQRVAVSVNVKERNDFSCALLDSEGKLVVNAPHIPVHLGSLGICVRAVSRFVKMEPGDTVITNHPGYGGSHLPDITLITPVYASSGNLAGYVVNRAHHAEIGGKAPGSMPPHATSLSDEGVVIPPVHLVRKGRPQWAEITGILENAGFPTRALKENLADINGALAANMSGKKALLDLIDQYGEQKIKQYMTRLKEHACGKTLMALSRLGPGEFLSREVMDEGQELKVSIRIAEKRCTIDFTGSSGVQPGNMNATAAIVNSVVIYVLRLLIDEPIPLNDGILDPVDIILPEGMLNPSFSGEPETLPAIVGGNVEVSQRLTDTLLKPFGILACSQGTMNNVLFGNGSFSYYETVCGGCGAGPGFDGASAVHHHMTNTRITDPEIFEHRYPVRLISFRIRKGSGGEGEFRGGDGVVREILFHEPVTLSLLTQHRTVAPYGLFGGAPGSTGEQYILTVNGEKVALKSIDGYDISKGDRLVIKTPGGGGFGNFIRTKPV